MAQQINPRGTFLQIADAVKGQIAADEGMTQLPSVAELMRIYGVSRGVVLRTFAHLHQEGVAEPVPGSRWRVVRPGQASDPRPLDERIAEVFDLDDLNVGDDFPSASLLSARFSVSRPTVSKALDKLETAGLLSEGGQGKVRKVRALPSGKERS